MTRHSSRAPVAYEDEEEPTAVTQLLNEIRGAVDKADKSYSRAVDTAQAMVKQAKKRESKPKLRLALSCPPPRPIKE